MRAGQQRGMRPPALAAETLLHLAVSGWDRAGVRSTAAADAQRLSCLLLAWMTSQAAARMSNAVEQPVTVMFCDMANYSMLAERAGPSASHRLVQGILERVTACVETEGGNVVDYYGDGMLAMWNAPTARADHAARACRSALAIQREVPALAATWAEQAETPLRLRCTLNTGPALVGNTGTTRRGKYGPSGHTVNIAQRVQTAAKYFGAPIVLTVSTRAQLDGPAFSLRRLGSARLPSMAQPTELYELHAPETAWLATREAFEHALNQFEAGDWHGSCQTARSLLDVPQQQLDLASLRLLGRAVEHLTTAAPARVGGVWELAGGP